MPISNPEIPFEIIPAYQQEQDEAQKLLFIGQKTSAGSAVSGSLVQSIGNANEQNALFGEDSILANMIFEAKRYNKQNRFDAIPLDDHGSGVAATGSFTISGAATAAGSFTFIVGNKIKHSYTIVVANGDTDNSIGNALADAITADSKVRVTAVNVSGVVTLTAVNKGYWGNYITLRVIGSVAGLSVSVAAMTGGATDPALTNIFDVIGSQRYQSVIFPASYILEDASDTIVNFLASRWNPGVDKILDGIGFTSYYDSLANFKTATVAQNSNVINIIVTELVDTLDFRGSAMIAHGDEIAAQFAAIRALRLTEDAAISNYVVATSGARDAFGGIHMATYPYHNTPFAWLPLIDEDKMWTDQERADLKDVGFTVIGNNIANNTVILDSVLTRYKTDPAGNPDISYKYLNYVDQASVVREYFHNNMKEAFANMRLTSGELVAGFSMANKGLIKSEMVKLYRDLADFALVPAGFTSESKFKDSISADLLIAEGLARLRFLDIVVTQLRKIDTIMQLYFPV